MKKKVLAAAIIVTMFTVPVYVSAETVQSENTEEAAPLENAEESNISDTDTIEKVEYYDKLIENETKKRDYEIYKNQLKAQLCELQIAYLKELEAELEEKYKIEKTKLELGYSTDILVEEAQNNQIAVSLQIQTAEEQQRLYKDMIELNGGVYEETTFTEQTEELKSDYVSDFLENSVQLMYYKVQLQEYNETLETVGGYGTIFDELQKQIELCELQEKQYEINLEIYVKNLQTKYSSVERQVKEKENQIVVAEKKIENAVIMEQEGKLSKLRLKEMERELQGLQYEKAAFICEMKRICYILENALENQEV